jgi:hypothetical protein
MGHAHAHAHAHALRSQACQKVYISIYDIKAPMTEDTSQADALTDAHRAMWHALASSQGLVCLICGRVPRLERRPDFYDTGLCRDCAPDVPATEEVEAP